MSPLQVHVLLSTFNHLAFNGSRMSVTLYAAFLHQPPALIGALAASFGVVSAFTSVAVGRWVDRVGPRRPMMIASLMVVFGTLLAAASRSIWPLFLACPVMGMFNSTFQIATAQTIGRYGGPSDRPKNFALQSLGISIATFVGPLIAGVVIDHFSFPMAFLMLAFFGGVPLTVLGLKGLHFPPIPEKKREAKGSARGWSLLRERDLRRAYVIACLNNAVWAVVSFMIPLYGAQIGMSATLIGTLMASLSTGTVGIRVIMGPLSRRWSAWALLLFAQAVMALGFLVMPFTAWFYLLVPCAFVIGVGLGLAGPLSTSLMYDASPPDKVAEVIGMRTTMANVAQTIVPIMSGAVGSAFGVGPVFWFVAAVVLGDVWSNRGQMQPQRAS